MIDAERAAIGRYKEYFDDHFGVIDNLQQLWLSPFDADSYPGIDRIDALFKYIEETRTFARHLSLAARYRQQHYEIYLKPTDSEDAEHRHWREGMNEAANNAEQLLKTAEAAFETGFDELLVARLEPAEQLADFVFKVKNPKPRTHNIALMPRIKKPALSKRQLLHRLQCAKRVKEFDKKQDDDLMELAIKQNYEPFECIKGEFIRATSTKLEPAELELVNTFPTRLLALLKSRGDWITPFVKEAQSYLVALHKTNLDAVQEQQFIHNWRCIMPDIVDAIDPVSQAPLMQFFTGFLNSLIQTGHYCIFMLGVYLIDVIRAIEHIQTKAKTDAIYMIAVYCFSIVLEETEINAFIKTVNRLANHTQWKIKCYQAWTQSYYSEACVVMDILMRVNSKEKLIALSKLSVYARYLKPKDPRNAIPIAKECKKLGVNLNISTSDAPQWKAKRAAYLAHLQSVN